MGIKHGRMAGESHSPDLGTSIFCRTCLKAEAWEPYKFFMVLPISLDSPWRISL